MSQIFLLRTSLAEIYRDIYNKLEPHKFGGIFAVKKKTIIIRDPELIKNVLIKDFEYFHDRGTKVDQEVDPLGYHLFNMRGEEWKNLRIKLTSTFTTGKMKMMFPLVNECGKKLNTVLANLPDSEGFDIKDLAARFTTDTIGTCAFGLETNSLDNPDSEFRRMGKAIFKFRYQSLIRSVWTSIPPTLIKRLKLDFIEKKIQDYFMEIVDETVQYREKNKISRNDFLDLLIALKNNTIIEKFQDTAETDDLEKFLAQVGDKRIKSNIDMSNAMLAAQCFVFFIAGFETSSTTLGFLLLELAQNEEIQNKVRDEIRAVLENNDNELTYDSMKQMTYTDMAIAEALRKYPPAGILMREANKNYKIPNTKIIIPANTAIIIPVFGIHRDAKYYDNPEEFRPERFTEREKAKRPHYTYLPFGEGPRVCIAERFAKMQVKIGLVYMLKDFSYHLSPKMKFPLEFEKNFGLLTVRNGIWLQRTKL
uniref:Cytochrome P450 6PZ1 n=1 Tax=Phenacoccus solenopsis TaxID=483260 RepID=A0A5P1JZ43_9HEMI|nr:cytochrome P450 6PZ1 [Phenacoccus solenopsis]